jgi:D-arabinose 1-dehydrogenase-like Zn-dependent alcohol dehydrogenase
MLAMNYRGPQRVRVDHKPMPKILHPQDAIVRVMRSCMCGSDLHLYNGSVPDTRVGMTFGHEFTGVVEQLGEGVEKLKVGDHVLVPFNIACGKCVFCQQGLYGNCHESNPQATAVGGIFGYSHTAGGYDGGQAEYVRVPYADVSPTVIPEGTDPDDAVLLTDVVPTGYQAAEMGGIRPGDTVVVFGAGPVGIMAARCAWLFGAGRVIVIDCVDYGLEFARNYAPCEAYDYRSLEGPVVLVKRPPNPWVQTCASTPWRPRPPAVCCRQYSAGNCSCRGICHRASLGDQRRQEGRDRLHSRGVRPDRRPRPDRERGQQGHHHPGEPGLGEKAAVATDQAGAKRRTRSEGPDHQPRAPGGLVGCLQDLFGEARRMHQAGANTADGQNIGRNHSSFLFVGAVGGETAGGVIVLRRSLSRGVLQPQLAG